MADGALPILMYHGLHADADAAGVFDPVYSVHPGEFARQLDWLVDQGYRAIRLSDCQRMPTPSKCVVITFDDGDVSNLAVALPLLSSRGMCAEIFVTADFVGRDGRLNRAQVRELSAAGMAIQSHGRTHRYLADLDARELDAELIDSKLRLEAMTGQPVHALALPGGRGGERERRAALRAGYRQVLNSLPGNNVHRTAQDYLQRVVVTRGMPIARFAQLVAWQGVYPRLLRGRYRTLALAKSIVGNRNYERLREQVLRS